MIGLVAELKVKDGEQAAFEALMRDLMAQVKANEPGALLYQLHRKRGEAGTYVMLERYADEAALAGHASQPHFLAASAQLRTMLAAPPVMTIADEVN